MGLRKAGKGRKRGWGWGGAVTDRLGEMEGSEA